MLGFGSVHGVPRARIKTLEAVPFFKGIPARVLARIDGHCDEIEVPAGEVLTREGAGSYEAFIIEAGTADVRVGDDVVQTAGPGELIGELGILRNSVRAATVVATTPMRLLVLNRRDLQWLFDNDRLLEKFQENIKRHVPGTSD